MDALRWLSPELPSLLLLSPPFDTWKHLLRCTAPIDALLGLGVEPSMVSFSVPSEGLCGAVAHLGAASAGAANATLPTLADAQQQAEGCSTHSLSEGQARRCGEALMWMQSPPNESALQGAPLAQNDALPSCLPPLASSELASLTNPVDCSEDACPSLALDWLCPMPPDSLRVLVRPPLLWATHQPSSPVLDALRSLLALTSTQLTAQLSPSPTGLSLGARLLMERDSVLRLGLRQRSEVSTIVRSLRARPQYLFSLYFDPMRALDSAYLALSRPSPRLNELDTWLKAELGLSLRELAAVIGGELGFALYPSGPAKYDFDALIAIAPQQSEAAALVFERLRELAQKHGELSVDGELWTWSPKPELGLSQVPERWYFGLDGDCLWLSSEPRLGTRIRSGGVYLVTDPELFAEALSAHSLLFAIGSETETGLSRILGLVTARGFELRANGLSENATQIVLEALQWLLGSGLERWEDTP
jgi:hypothetical protein